MAAKISSLPSHAVLLLLVGLYLWPIIEIEDGWP